MFSCKSSSNRMSGGKPNIKIIKSRIFLSLSIIIEAFYNNDATACIQVLSITETPYINVTFVQLILYARINDKPAKSA